MPAQRVLFANVPTILREYTLLRERRCCARQGHFRYPLAGEFTRPRRGAGAL